MIKLCIFDLDGTVLDTLPAIAYHGNKALVQNNLPSIPIKEYKFLAGDGMKTLIKIEIDANIYYQFLNMGLIQLKKKFKLIRLQLLNTLCLKTKTIMIGK